MPLFVLRYLFCALVCTMLCTIAKQNNSLFEAKIARQLFNVANIKYRFLSGSGHSVRFLNGFGKLIQSSNRISEKLFLT